MTALTASQLQLSQILLFPQPYGKGKLYGVLSFLKKTTVLLGNIDYIWKTI